MANQVLYGFHNLKDVLGNRLNTVDAELIATAIQQSVDEHNRQLDALMGLFVERVTAPTERYKQIGPIRLQPLDENGRALPTKPFGYYDVGYPIQSGGSAWGANYVARAKMTVQDANDATAQMLEADMRWMRDHILGALFANGTWTFVDDYYGNITVQPLASGDSVIYAVQTGADQGLTDTHQLAQAGAIADATNPFPTIRSELLEHPENGGDVIVLVPTANKAATQLLASYNPIADTNIRRGANSDEFVGTLGVATPGTLFGYEDSGVFLVEWPTLPSNYLVGVTTDGNRPLGMREHAEAELQGFRRVAERDNHPFYESQWLRMAGFGGRNRVGAVVMRVSNGSYAVPTSYSVPMP